MARWPHWDRQSRDRTFQRTRARARRRDRAALGLFWWDARPRPGTGGVPRQRALSRPRSHRHRSGLLHPRWPACAGAVQAANAVGTTTRIDSLAAPMAVEVSIGGGTFTACALTRPARTLGGGNRASFAPLPAHEVGAERAAIAAVGTKISSRIPDFNPIEQAVATSKAILRTAATGSVDVLEAALAQGGRDPEACADDLATSGSIRVGASRASHWPQPRRRGGGCVAAMLHAVTGHAPI